MPVSVYQFEEKQSGELSFTLRDETNAVVPAASLTTATLTVREIDSAGIVNSKNAVNVLNANGVSIDAQGRVVWTIAPDDNSILVAANKLERHVVTFRFTWAAGAKQHNQEFYFDVRNLSSVS